MSPSSPSSPLLFLVVVVVINNRRSTTWFVKDFYVYSNGTGGMDGSIGTFVITLHRLTATIVSTTVLPVILFNILIDLVYLLPPASGERVGFSVTLVLTFSVLLMGVGNIIPTSSDEQVTLGEKRCRSLGCESYPNCLFLVACYATYFPLCQFFCWSVCRFVTIVLFYDFFLFGLTAPAQKV